MAGSGFGISEGGITGSESGFSPGVPRGDPLHVGNGLGVVARHMVRDGKIAVWRDYFDMGTYTRALAG